ncbi:GntR family transcriptional regulator [Sphingosinicella terrae]|uniref:GntR family transcriptional regulator n=1 Tax=Sphingosinicella terrae TaxID=2172047 RepID=UPI0013B3A042|nr:GntR family transcriptional regulator [Sphingosinicella terrae]
MLKRSDREPAVDGRSVPERIADAIDYAIAAQNYAIGDRLIEMQLAEQYDSSRGSVREALRILAQRGSVELISGRGGVVRGYSLDRLADAFAAAGMLIALGARYVARHRSVAVLARIGERVGRIEKMVVAGFSPPLEFATALGGFTATIVVGSENHYVRSQVSAILNRSVWRAMWEHPCDHLTYERQREELSDVQRIHALLKLGDGDGAERELRGFHQRHCDAVITELAHQRGERAPASPPLAAASPRGTEGDGIEARLARIEAEMALIRQTRPAEVA